MFFRGGKRPFRVKLFQPVQGKARGKAARLILPCAQMENAFPRGRAATWAMLRVNSADIESQHGRDCTSVSPMFRRRYGGYLFVWGGFLKIGLAFVVRVWYLMRTLCERSVAQSGSAFGSGPKGQGFKSLRSDHLEQLHPWWNWQTRKIQVLMLRGVWVRVPPGAPQANFSCAPIVYRLGHKVLILGRAVRLRLGVPPVRKSHCPHRLSVRTQGSHPWKSGPTPLGGAIRRGGRAWLNAHDSKSCVPQGTGGSNPSLSATFVYGLPSF